MPLDPRIARYLRGMQQRLDDPARPHRLGRPSLRERLRALRVAQQRERGLPLLRGVGGELGGRRTERRAWWCAAVTTPAITLRLIGEPVVLPGPITYTLGFQATPVKPELPKGARAGTSAAGGTPTPHETVDRLVRPATPSPTVSGSWRARRPLQKRDREFGAPRRAAVLLRDRQRHARTTCPVFRLFEPLWRSAWSVFLRRGRPSADNGLRARRSARTVSPRCARRRELPGTACSTTRRQLLQTGVVGLYTDTDEVFADDNPRHGCGYLDAFGRAGVTWTILSKRRFAKRLAALVREAGGARRYWMTHAHTRLVPPVHGFADFWCPGEELTGALGRNRLVLHRTGSTTRPGASSTAASRAASSTSSCPSSGAAAATRRTSRPASPPRACSRWRRSTT